MLLILILHGFAYFAPANSSEHTDSGMHKISQTELVKKVGLGQPTRNYTREDSRIVKPFFPKRVEQIPCYSRKHSKTKKPYKER